MNRLTVRARVAALTAAAVGLTGLLVVAPTTAEAAPSGCYVQAKVPAKITVDRPYKEVKVPLVDSCEIAEFAGFDVYGPEGLDWVFIYDGNTVDYLDVYDDQPLGKYKTRDSFGVDRNYEEIKAKESGYAIKLGTKTSLSSKRSKDKVTLTVSASSYDPKKDKYAAWSPKGVKIQRKSGSSWKTVKTVTLKSGKATVSLTDKKKQQYRAVVAETSTRWGVTSKSQTR